MNKWIAVPITGVLAVGLITIGVLYLQEIDKLKEAQSEIIALAKNVSILTGNVSPLLEEKVPAMEMDVLVMSRSLSTLEGNLSTLEENILALGGDIPWEAENVFLLLEEKVPALEMDVLALEENLSVLEENLSVLEEDVSGLEAALAGSPIYTLPEVVALLEPSVVRINVSGPGWTGSGSGVIISKAGHVLTNNHVIEGASAMEVTLMSGQTYDGIAVGTDIDQDLAVVKIFSARTDFPEAALGSSADITMGEEVLAMGHPSSLGFEGQATFTKGIISAFRTINGYEYVQTDAAISRGNSGGPLVNLKGEVIGINTLAQARAEGINFAIPIDKVKTFIQNAIG